MCLVSIVVASMCRPPFVKGSWVVMACRLVLRLPFPCASIRTLFRLSLRLGA